MNPAADTMLNTAGQRIRDFLKKRAEEGRYRSLRVGDGALVDFSSNDYLGLARSAYIAQEAEKEWNAYAVRKAGATGSRLLHGNSALFEELEDLLAETHHAEAALLFNSGFDANVGLLSTLLRPGDTLFYDESVHASIRQGIKLSEANAISFTHNDLADLEQKLLLHRGSSTAFVVTESLFSMDGDRADLRGLATLARKYGVEMIVDEAHANGLFGENGSGLCNEAGVEKACFARVYTFGKAIGSHGAAVLGSQDLKDYLINFCPNFIYSTALETSGLLRVKQSYLLLQNTINQQIKLKYRMHYFRDRMQAFSSPYQFVGQGPVYALIVPGNDRCRSAADHLRQNGMDVRAILSPTVPAGTERLRIILHAYNTGEEIERLFHRLSEFP